MRTDGQAGLPRQAGNLPPGAPPRPPWMTEAQYELFLRKVSMDLGAQCITAWSVGAEHLGEDQRRDLLSGLALRPTLVFVCTIYARLDAAAQRSREGAIEKQFVRSVCGDLAEKVSA